MKKVMVGSKNPLKIQAVQDAFSTVWPNEAWEIIGVEVDSAVSSQPMSDEESIIGATNRANKSLDTGGADFGVGLESGMGTVSGCWFEHGWVVIVSKDGETGMGSTARIIVPDKMVDLVRQGLELGSANDVIFGLENSKQSEGHFGLMTKNALTRSQSLRDGVICALATFIHPDLK